MGIVSKFYQIDRRRMVWKLRSAEYQIAQIIFKALTVFALDGFGLEIIRLFGKCRVGVESVGKFTRAGLQEGGLSR